MRQELFGQQRPRMNKNAPAQLALPGARSTLLTKGSTMNSVTEIWKPISGHEHYEVSNKGNVRSLGRFVPHWQGGVAWRKGGPLKPIMHHGYATVKLGRPELHFGIHRLVAWAFIGPQEAGKVVNHIDGIKANNVPNNLEYITSSENVLHAYRTGLISNAGDRNGNSHARRRAKQQAA